MKTRIRNLTYVIIAILILLVLSACRSSKSERSALSQSARTKQTNDIKSSETTELYTELRRAIEKALTEHLNIMQKETEYDTEKPIIPETGKPPIKREAETTVAKKTEDKSKITETNNTKVMALGSTEEKTEKESERKAESAIIAETNMQKEEDIFFKWVGRITLFLALLGLGCYILYKWLKKRIPV